MWRPDSRPSLSVLAQDGHSVAAPGASGVSDRADEALLRELVVVLSRKLPLYYEAALARLAIEVELPQTDIRALVFIMEFDALSTGHLAQLLGISHGGATAMIDRLEDAGFLQRERDENDRRVVILRAVPERCEALLEPELYVLGRLSHIARQVSAGDVVDTYDFLARCTAFFKKDTAKWLAEGPSAK